ncbi:MAG: protein kinase [Ferruginibacter sp.]
MIGQRIHCYEINAHLGQGGMGNVFRATDSMLGREVALKMLHPELTIQPQFLERFKKEARILAQLLHPNIAVIYNFIEQDGNHFMVMEYIEGTSLDELMKKYGVLPAQFVVPVCIQALEGLQHAHKKNVFHRDIKPANLMITNDGTLKLMDFGIAKVAGEQKMTQVNKIVGTIEFMAPELIEGKDASAASDIYSMGATIYELITGRIPFEGDTDFNMMQGILKARPLHPEKINTAVPRALSEIVLKAMDKDPERRYINARAFQQALIAAFPLYRDIDMNVLKTGKETTFVDAINSRPTIRTRVGISRPLVAFQQYKGKVMEHKKISIAILCLLFLVITIFSINAITGKSSVGSPDTPTDSTKEVIQNNIGLSSMPVSNSDNTTLQQPVTPQPVVNEPVIEKIETPVLEKPRRAKNNDPEPKSKPIEKEQVPAEPAVPVEKRDIYISSEVIVSLTLISNPNPDLKPKVPQPVTYSVTRPVFYDGKVIVKQGAIANGSLEIGRSRTDIIINSVEASNGQRISLKAKKAHGDRDMIHSQIYEATIQSGTRINL